MDIVGALTKRPPQNFTWLFTKRDVFHDLDMRPDLDALQRNVKAHSELSLIEEAARRLK